MTAALTTKELIVKAPISTCVKDNLLWISSILTVLKTKQLNVNAPISTCVKHKTRNFLKFYFRVTHILTKLKEFGHIDETCLSYEFHNLEHETFVLNRFMIDIVVWGISPCGQLLTKMLILATPFELKS